MASTLYVTRTKSHCDCRLYDNSMMEVKKRRDRVVTAEEQCGYSTTDFTMSVQKTLASLYSIFRFVRNYHILIHRLSEDYKVFEGININFL